MTDRDQVAREFVVRVSQQVRVYGTLTVTAANADDAWDKAYQIANARTGDAVVWDWQDLDVQEHEDIDVEEIEGDDDDS